MSGDRRLELAEQLLDREHDALADGDYEELARLLPEKQKIFETLALANPESNRLALIRTKAKRNQRLLAATGKGIRAACEQIDRVLKAEDELTTYDCEGRLSSAGSRAKTSRRV